MFSFNYGFIQIIIEEKLQNGIELSKSSHLSHWVVKIVTTWLQLSKAVIPLLFYDSIFFMK